MGISDPHESHSHVHGTHGYESIASHEDEHSHQKIERTGIYLMDVVVAMCFKTIMMKKYQVNYGKKCLKTKSFVFIKS